MRVNSSRAQPSIATIGQQTVFRLSCPPKLQTRQVHCSADAQQQQQQQQQQQHQLVLTAELTSQQQVHLQALQQAFTRLEVDKLVSSNRSVLDLPTGDWLRFFEGYGLHKMAMWNTLRYSTQHLSDPYTAGAAIRWLKQLGPWTDADVADRLLPCYPKVLATSTDTLQSLHDAIIALGFTSPDVQQLLWEFPGLMADFREEQLPLISRMVESRRNKYTNGGLYID